MKEGWNFISPSCNMLYWSPLWSPGDRRRKDVITAAIKGAGLVWAFVFLVMLLHFFSLFFLSSSNTIYLSVRVFFLLIVSLLHLVLRKDRYRYDPARRSLIDDGSLLLYMYVYKACCERILFFLKPALCCISGMHISYAYWWIYNNIRPIG